MQNSFKLIQNTIGSTAKERNCMVIFAYHFISTVIAFTGYFYPSDISWSFSLIYNNLISSYILTVRYPLFYA